MNIVSTEVSLFVVAKACNCNQANELGRKVTYEYIDMYYSTYLDKSWTRFYVPYQFIAGLNKLQ